MRREDRDGTQDPARFIAAHLAVAPAPALPEIRLHAAGPMSGLGRRLAAAAGAAAGEPPYWAYHWAGGTVLARHILDHPETVRGLRVLDLGAGSGVVGIAAALAGAAEVLSADVDRNAVAAVGLNAALNGVALRALAADLTLGPPPPVDLVLVGDLFYEAALAARATAFLDRCLAAGIPSLVGDPGRAFLPRARLSRIADYAVPDFGDGSTAATRPSSVFAFAAAAG